MIQPAALRHGGTIQPSLPIPTADPRSRECSSARAQGLASEVCHDKNDCIMTGCVGLPSRHNAPGAAIRCSSALRHGAAALQYAQHGAIQRFGSRYNFCIVTGGGDDTAVYARNTACNTASAHATRPVRATTRPSTATTRRSVRHNTALCTWSGHNARIACTQLGILGCAPCALDQVLTHCTVLSHCLKYCS